MANLYISEYAGIAENSLGVPVPAPMEPSVAEQKVAFTGATASAAFNADTKFVKLTADADSHVKFGSDPTAATSNQPLKANTPQFFGVEGGHKVSAIEA